MAGVAAADLHADVAQREIELVVDDDDVGRRDLEERRRGLNAVARQVHERHRLEERRRARRRASPRVQTPRELLFEVRPARGRAQRVDDHEADVVAVPSYSRPGLPRPTTSMHGSGATSSSRPCWRRPSCRRAALAPAAGAAPRRGSRRRRGRGTRRAAAAGASSSTSFSGATTAMSVCSAGGER